MLGATLGVKDYLDRVCREIQRLDPAQIENLSDADRGRPTTPAGSSSSSATAARGPTPRTSAKTWPSAPCATSRTRSGSRS